MASISSILSSFLGIDVSDPRIKLYESDRDGFKVIMKIFSRSEIDGVRRVLYTLSKDFGNSDKVAYGMSHSSVLICNLLKSRNPELFNKNVNQSVRNKGKYRDWVIAVKVRDHYKCRVCDSETDLQVHHIKSVRECPELITRLDNGVTLCKICHNKAHNLLSQDELNFFLNRREQS